MNSFRDKLIRFETRLQGAIEGGTAHLFPRVDKLNDLAVRLRLAMREQCRSIDNGEVAAPNVFQIFTAPQYAQELRQDGDYLRKLQLDLEMAAHEAGFTFLNPPVIQIVEEPMIPYQQVSVNAYFDECVLPSTTNIEMNSAQPEITIPKDAFLIVNGVKVYSLVKPVINIGRNPDNQIVINDPRVSRQHAQLRAVNGKYFLFDLGSTAGTCLNNQRIHQAILAPGDVISLAGIPLVYGQESPDPSLTNRLEFSPQE